MPSVCLFVGLLLRLLVGLCAIFFCKGRTRCSGFISYSRAFDVCDIVGQAGWKIKFF